MLGIFALLFRLHRKVHQVSGLYAFYALLFLVELYSVGLCTTLRSHIFSFLFFTLELYWLECVRFGLKEKHSLWLLVPLITLWGNLHGGFVMGLLLLICYGLGEALLQRKLQVGMFHWIIAVVSGLTLGVLNPYGFSYWIFLFQAWTLDRSMIGEWTPLRFDNWKFLPAQLAFLLGTSIPLMRWAFRNQQDPEETQSLLTPTIVLFMVIAMMLKALRMQPFVAWTLIAFLPLFFSPDFIRRVVPKPVKTFSKKQASLVCTTLPSLILLFALGMTIYLQITGNLLKVNLSDEMSPPSISGTRYPVGAIEYLRQSPFHGNLMVFFGAGEFALWELYPRFKISMDGRYEEVYNQKQFMENHIAYYSRNIKANQTATALINQSKADFILTEPSIPNVGMLIQSNLWKPVYTDAYFVVLARKTALKRFPDYQDSSFMNAFTTASLALMTSPSELARFKTSEY